LTGEYEYECGTCGRPVHQRRKPRGLNVYCSHRCRWTAANHERADALAAARATSCTTCGAQFTPPRADGRYCSPACRQRAYRQRRASADVT
jgi:DNA-directed RNA polymerase subunit RPC12/RpoP